MTEGIARKNRSRELAVKLYDMWVRQRQERKELHCTDSKGREIDWKKDPENLRRENFVNRLAGPREEHLAQLKRMGKEMTTADKIALLALVELPAVEISSLMHKLSLNLAKDPKGVYSAAPG
jgi:hypothetical protein